MSTESSPTTPEAKSAEVAASSSAALSTTDTLDQVQHHKRHQPPQGLGDHFASAHDLTPTQAPSPPALRNAFNETELNPIAPAVPGYIHEGQPSWLPFATAPSFVPHAASHPARGGIFIAPDGSLVRSDAGFKAGSVPGNYHNRADYNMVHRAPGSGMRVAAQQYPTQAVRPSQAQPAPRPFVPTGSYPTFAPVPPYAPVATPTPAPTSPRQVEAVIPPPGTPQRLILLGPLKMIRSHCVAKVDQLRPILVWLDHFLGEELRRPALTDPMLPNVVYAVNIPMDDEHWRDWNKVLTVFPRAAAWQEALTPEEPFDQVTAGHATAPLFVEGEPLQALLDNLVDHYKLGLSQDFEKPWDMPGQTEWPAPLARETSARR